MREKLFFLFVMISIALIIPSSVTAETASGTSTLKEKMHDLKTERKNSISQIKDQAKEQIQERKDLFKERLQTIKDARKRLLTQTLDEKIAAANAKHTARFSDVLTRLQEALDKIKPDVKDPKILSDIKTAQSKIDLAKAAVTSQAAKVYTIEITDEATLRKNVGATISQFRKDLMQVHKLVVDAKQAVQALRRDKSMLKREASSSATQ